MIINDQISTQKPQIALIGEAMIELSDMNFPGQSARIGIAGDTLNTAVYLARALNETKWACDYLTVLGQDRLSDQMIRFIEAEGIGTGAIGRSATRHPAVYAITVDAVGERSFSYWRDASAARDLFQTDRPTLPDLAGYGVIYMSAITLAILPSDIRFALIKTCADLKAAGHIVVFDSNYRPKLWRDPQDARQSIAAMWTATTIALPSHDDEILLHSGETAEDTLARIQSYGVPEIALKCGPAGPLLSTPGQVTKSEYRKAENVVDTTAAGDSFNAGYLAARLGSASMAEAAQAGHALACKVIGAPGAILPREERGIPEQ